MKKVTIKRSKWQRGGDDAMENLFPEETDTQLWGNKTECGCCLGHVLHQAHKVPYKELRGRYYPACLADSENKGNALVTTEKNEFRSIYFANTDFASKAITINDSENISNKMREYKLRRLFKSHGYELEFVD